MITPLLLAFQFYTRIPIRLQREPTSKEHSWALAFGPLVGLGIGYLLYSVQWLLHQITLDPFPAAMILFLLYFWLTGGIHFDGVADTFDGAGSSKSGSDLLAVIKDPRVGSFGAVFLILAVINYLYFFFQAFQQESNGLLWLAPWVVSRFFPILLGISLPYLRSEGADSYRNSFLEELGWGQLIFATFLLVSFLIVIVPLKSIFLIIGMITLTFGLCYLFFRFRFQGVNGDLLGASIVVGEILLFYTLL